MMNVKKIFALVLVVVMAVMMLPACSSDAVYVGYTIYEPMNYKDGEGNLIGFDTELAKIVFENLGYEVVFTEIKWENKYTDLQSGTIDCIWNGFTSNGEDDGKPRAELVDFSYNYMENKQVVVVRKDSGIVDAAGLSGKVGYVEAASAGESYAKSAFAGATIKTATKQTDALMQVQTNSADFAVLDAQLAKSLVGENDFSELMVVEVLSSDVEYYAVGFAKGSELEELAKDGTLETLAKKYGVENSIVLDFSNQK